MNQLQKIYSKKQFPFVIQCTTVLLGSTYCIICLELDAIKQGLSEVEYSKREILIHEDRKTGRKTFIALAEIELFADSVNWFLRNRSKFSVTKIENGIFYELPDNPFYKYYQDEVKIQCVALEQPKAASTFRSGPSFNRVTA